MGITSCSNGFSSAGAVVAKYIKRLREKKDGSCCMFLQYNL